MFGRHPIQNARADQQPHQQVCRDLGQMDQIGEHTCGQAAGQQQSERAGNVQMEITHV